MKKQEQRSPWRNRIIGHGEEAPSQFLANPHNFRLHPPLQQNALMGVLTEIGWLQEVIVNVRASELWPSEDRNVHTLIDGHLRVKLALQHNQAEVPVKYVDLTPLEEAEALVTFDPLSSLASSDKEQLEALLREVRSGDNAVHEMLEDLATREGLFQKPKLPTPGDAETTNLECRWDIVISCDSEASQGELLTRLTEEGYKCRALIV